MRFLRFPVIRFFIGFLILSLAATAMQSITNIWPGRVTGLSSLFSVIISVLVVGLTYYGFVRFIERRDATELSLAGAAKELTAGAALGALLFSATIGTPFSGFG